MSIVVTSQDMYTAFLQGVNKVKTSTIFPDEAEIWFHNEQLNWVKNKYSDEERTQKRIDDLRTLKVETDPLILPSSLNTFALPYNENPVISGDHGYLFMLTVAFKLNYVNNDCGLTGVSDLIIAKPFKTTKKFVSNPFKRPADNRLFYEIINNNVILHTGTQSTGNSCYMEYYKYPRNVLVDTVNQDSELPIHARQEIVDNCIKAYLENITDNRFQTNIIEDKSISK